MEFFTNMEPLLRVFWYIALPVSLIFVLQSILSFAGADGHDGHLGDVQSDADHGDNGMSILTIRNLINFLLGFSWTGISFYKVISNHFLLISIAAIIGILFVALFIYMLIQMQKLSEDNSFKIAQTLHKTGTVYLAIPANRSGTGIIQISINGAVHEINAITDQARIDTGAIIQVLKVEDDHLVLVKKI